MSRRSIWFIRTYNGFTGGHLVHSRYYQNSSQHSMWQAKIVFTNTDELNTQIQTERNSLWPQGQVSEDEFLPAAKDVIFVAGTDWEFINSRMDISTVTPRINLIQGLRHAHPDTPLYHYLTERAIRICVSEEVAAAIRATGLVNGPIIVIPNGVELPPELPQQLSPVPLSQMQRSGLLIAGYKNPELARQLSISLAEMGIQHECLLNPIAHADFLAKLTRCEIIVCLPLPEEGFYLPPLEAMAQGALVVTPDCGGNRSFCFHEKNCLMPDYSLQGLLEQIRIACAFEPGTRSTMVAAARATAEKFSLESEREKFYQVLTDVDQLW